MSTHPASDAAMEPVIRDLTHEEKLTTSWLEERSAKWRPAGYMDQIPRRVSYIDRDMVDDLEALLQSEFARSWTLMQNHYILMPMVSQIASKRAKCFRGRGQRFFLRHKETGRELTSDPEMALQRQGADDELTDEQVKAIERRGLMYHPAAAAFEDLIDMAQLPANLRDVDIHLEQVHALADKVWWDIDHVRCSVFTPDHVRVAVNETRYWDPYAAAAVAFELPGEDGNYSSDSRWEVWGTRDPEQVDETDEMGRPLFEPAMHFVAGGSKKYSYNEGDRNPYIGWDGAPMYPFQWFTDDPDQIYPLGSDDLVLFNRNMNMGLTYLTYNMSWAMLGIPCYEHQVGQGKAADLPTQRFLTPQHVASLPPGVKLSFVRNDIPLESFTSTFEMLMQYQALMHELAPRSMSVQDGIPTSGIAMEIELMGLAEHREEKIEMLRPQVRDLLRRMIVVSNRFGSAYARDKSRWTAIDLDEFEPAWEPGKLEAAPQDITKTTDSYQRLIDLGAASVDDLAAAVHNVPREQAADLVDANIRRNAEVKRMRTEMSLADDGAEERVFGEVAKPQDPEAAGPEPAAIDEGGE